MNHAFHIGLHVKDIENTSKFYSKFFGTEALKTKSDYVKFELPDPALVISFSKSTSVDTNFGHLGIRVNTAEELADYKIRIDQAGLDFEDENNTTCCYARQDKFWVSDPDGYRWEVFLFKEDVNEVELSDKASCC